MFGFLAELTAKLAGVGNAAKAAVRLVPIQDTRRSRGVLGAAAASTLCVALAVAAGVVPGPGATTAVHSTSGEAALASDLIPTKPTAATDLTADAGQAAAALEATSTTVTTAPAVIPSPTAPTTAAPPPPVTAAPAPEVTGGPPVVAAPPPSAPAPVPGSVPRRQPSSAEVQQAIDGMRQFVQTIFTPNHAQVNDLGDKVCTAFDQGQTVEQVKATGLQMVSKVPFTTVRPGADDYVVRTAITLYCPGHAPKLG